jgi:4-amino-4-deoxy-L-arabinose transferase-like glycosyltransferase
MKEKIKILQNKSLLVLFFIFFLGVFLRFYNLGVIPVGFHRDEAFFGYNAYSLLQTGRDITGDFLPLHLQSFLYSPAGYSYISIPFIALFGLSEFSVRFASAFFGSLTILVLYFLVRKLFHKYKYTDELSLLSSFFLAISPWHINLSRVATENVFVVFLVMLGIIFYYDWITKKNWWNIGISFICFSFSLFVYQAPRAFLPLFLPILYILFNKNDYKKLVIIFSVFIISIVIPVLFVLSSPQLSARMQMLSIFKHPETQLTLEEQIREDGQTGLVLTTRFFHNKVINYSSTFVNNYFEHFSYEFLFSDMGLPERYRVPSMGLLYLFEIPLLLIGLWKLISFRNKTTIILLSWLLLTPVGTAMTFDDVPNLQRTLLMLPVFSIISALGFLELWQFISRLPFKNIIKGLIILCIFYGVMFYLHQYYVHQVNHRPWHRQEGYKKLVSDLKELAPRYKKVISTSSESTPAIFFFFYDKYDPYFVQNKLKNLSSGYGEVNFNNITFLSEECPLYDVENIDKITGKKMVETNGKKDILYVNHGGCTITAPNVIKVSDILRSDNTVVFSLYEVK